MCRILFLEDTMSPVEWMLINKFKTMMRITWIYSVTYLLTSTTHSSVIINGNESQFQFILVTHFTGDFIFSESPALEEIYLNDNRFTSLNQTGFPAGAEIDLRNNQITHIGRYLEEDNSFGITYCKHTGPDISGATFICEVTMVS